MKKRTSKKALRVLSTATFLTMVASCAAPAFADAYGIALYSNYYLDQGSVSVRYEDGKYYVTQDGINDGSEAETDGQVTISNSKDGDASTATKNTVSVTVKDGTASNVTIKDVNIDNSSDVYDQKAGITVDVQDKDATANITLDNVTVDPGKDTDGSANYGGAGLEVKGSGTTSIELNRSNTLTGGYNSRDYNHAGIEKNDTSGTGKLIIRDDYNDDGNLKTEAQKKAEADNHEYSGSLTATASGSAAGIGSGSYKNTSNIEITGGNIKATGNSHGAGIGSGEQGNAEDITISGGNITAIGGDLGAGIGSGWKGSTSITISGGKINATGGSGAGVGGGESSGSTTIIITGGDVTGKSKFEGAGIGSGDDGDGKLNIEISGKNTHVTGLSPSLKSDGGSGIGTGNTSSHEKVDITIEDGTIEATGGVGIGVASDSDDTPADITISGGKITATGISGGAGIGTGDGWNSDSITNITISGGDITAVGDEGAAGIGAGNYHYKNEVNVTITGGKITAVGGEGAAAIGGGRYEDDSDESNLSKTTVSINSNDSDLNITAVVQGGGKGAIGKGTVDGDDPFGGKDFATITADALSEAHSALVRFLNHGTVDAETGKINGTVYKALHNKKYIEETYSNDTDAHQWANPEVLEEAAPGKPGVLRYHCAVEGCDATHDVSYNYVAPDDDDSTDDQGKTALELEVLAPDGTKQPFSVVQNGAERIYTSNYDNGTLTGTMAALEYLKDNGAGTITFVTNQSTSRFAVDDLLALVGEGDVFYLTHTGTEAPALLVVTNDHTDLLK